MSFDRSARVTFVGVAIAAVLLFFTPADTRADGAGPLLFNTYCASCHGADARGDGPVASMLRVSPPDLTRLDRRFGVPLERDKLAEYIDGRRDVLAHGSRDMPVWGRQFQEELLGQPATEDTTRRTIDSIVDYLISIQQVRGAAL